jgi:hypothetical protein
MAAPDRWGVNGNLKMATGIRCYILRELNGRYMVTLPQHKPATFMFSGLIRPKQHLRAMVP